MKFLDDEVTTWRRRGWVVVDGWLPADVVHPALAELRAFDPGVTTGGPVRRADQVDGEARFRGRQFDGTTLFPVPGCPQLNRLFIHPKLAELAGALLGTDDLRIYQSRVWSKHGDHTNYEQPHHLDRNHSLVPIRNGSPWSHVEMFVYLHDTDESNGAPLAVDRPAPGLGGAGTGQPVNPDEAPELYAAEVSAKGSAGSVFAYRSDVWHRGIDIAPGSERHIMAISFRTAAAEWIGFDAHPPLVNSADFVELASSCGPDELALFGVPRPGHEFWNGEVLDAMAVAYPDLDLTPWRRALD